MRNLDKYKGVIPAFYACYDKDGNISPEAVQALTKYFVEKGVKDLTLITVVNSNPFSNGTFDLAPLFVNKQIKKVIQYQHLTLIT